MKLRIIKEESVYRIQEYKVYSSEVAGWIYAENATNYKRWPGSDVPIGFKTEKEAEDFIEHNYIVKVVKEYEVE